MQRRFLSQLRNQWWGVPLILPALLMPLAGMLSPVVLAGHHEVYLLYLPLTLCYAFLFTYDWKALPGLLVALLLRYYLQSEGDLLQSAAIVGVFMFSLIFSWGGYRWNTQRHWLIAFDTIATARQRFIWTTLIGSVLFILGNLIFSALGLFAEGTGMILVDPVTLHTLINFQALLMASLACKHFCYYLIRSIRQPRFARRLWRKIQLTLQDVSGKELWIWFFCTAFLCTLLASPLLNITSLFTSDYSLSLVMFLMLYSAVRFGAQFTSISWAIVLLFLCQFHDGFIRHVEFEHQLAVVSSILTIFSLMVLVAAVLNARQRYLYKKSREISFIDPLLGLPNLRALTRDVAQHSQSTLCFLLLPSLEVVNRNYGLQASMTYKQKLAEALFADMLPGEAVYQFPAEALILRLNYESGEQRLQQIAQRLQTFCFNWDELPLNTVAGIGYCVVRPPVEDFYHLLGHLNAAAERSLYSGRPQNALVGASPASGEIKRKLAALHTLQQALEENDFLLQLQPVAGMRREHFYAVQVLLKAPQGEGEPIALNQHSGYSAIIHEFGLACQIDLWVLEQVCRFIQKQNADLPGMRFAVGLFFSTWCSASLVTVIRDLLRQYQIEPFQLMLEVVETARLEETASFTTNINELRRLGCYVIRGRFAIGGDYHTDLRTINTDMLRIDTDLVRNVLDSDLDYQLIGLCCQIARMRRIATVAEAVDSKATWQALQELGVDYVQGAYVGQAMPMNALPETDRLASLPTRPAATEPEPLVG